MAQRPVYRVNDIKPFYECHMVDFIYNGGCSVSQKQKNITAIHEAYHKTYPNDRVLEISTKSLQPIGTYLSAFNLLKYVPSIQKSIPVENVYQGGKVFEQNGPLLDLYEVTPREAKIDERLNQNGSLQTFYFEGKTFPTSPKTAFYDWIYMNAVMENSGLIEEFCQYDAFTDVEFNPKASINCQARAAAIFVSLFRAGIIEKIKLFDEFVNLTNKI